MSLDDVRDLAGADAAVALGRLLHIMTRLRDPTRGYPWDLAQTATTLAPYVLEEACEVVHAIEQGDPGKLRDELGDLLFQVVFHAQLGREAGTFDFADIAQAIAGKMERRHPHVFGDQIVADARAQTAAWEEIKRRERAGEADASVLADIPVALSGLTRATKLGRRAARVGFDWPQVSGVFAKVREEIQELEEAWIQGESAADAIREELGDVLFTLANLARHLEVDAEGALRAANAKFERRFRALEARLAEHGEQWATATADRLEALWEVVKRES